MVTASYESAVAPPEIVTFTKDGMLELISNFNSAKLEKLDLNDVETFWTKTSRGKSIRSMLVKPAHFDPAKSTLYLY